MDLWPVRRGVHLPDRIEHDAHVLFLELMGQPTRNFVVFTDTQEYADGVMTIVEGLYPGASERITFEVHGRPPGTTG